MQVVLKPGEKIDVTFEDSDGEISVFFGKEDIVVMADLPDDEGRDGVIYRETFGAGIPEPGSKVG